jgi:DNA-binding transcriptional MerR regulator
MSSDTIARVQIGELSDRTRVPKKTIRYYETIGVMPVAARNQSGYREYTDDAIGRLGFVRAAQSVGLTLGEIREVLASRDRGEAPCAHVAQLIERHAADLRQRIVALQAMHHDLQRLAQRARLAPATTTDDTLICHIVES